VSSMTLSTTTAMWKMVVAAAAGAAGAGAAGAAAGAAGRGAGAGAPDRAAEEEHLGVAVAGLDTRVYPGAYLN
jgi:hypothetical protein